MLQNNLFLSCMHSIITAGLKDLNEDSATTVQENLDNAYTEMDK